MSMEQDTKEFIELHFKRLEEKIDGFNDSLAKDIIRLQHNDEEHYSLDRAHRETCANNRQGLKDEIEETLSRFGSRIGAVENEYSKSEGQISGIFANYEKRIGEIEKSIEDKKDNFQDWLKTLFPYILVVGYLIIDKMGAM